MISPTDSEEPKEEGKWHISPKAAELDPFEVPVLNERGECVAVCRNVTVAEMIVSTHNAVPSGETGEVARELGKRVLALYLAREPGESIDNIITLALDNAVRGEREANAVLVEQFHGSGSSGAAAIRARSR